MREVWEGTGGDLALGRSGRRCAGRLGRSGRRSGRKSGGDLEKKEIWEDLGKRSGEERSGGSEEGRRGGEE